MLSRIVDGVVHRVERGNALNFGVAPIQAVSDFSDGIAIQEPAIFALGNPKPGQDTGLLVWIVSFESIQLLDRLLRESQVQLVRLWRHWALVMAPKLDQFTHP